MSTATLPTPHLEVTASDTMDLHSDDGLGFGDGDIDIDLDLRSPGGVDDDESLRDAGTDAGQEIQTVSGDLDDFMADNEDLIEEDVADETTEADLPPPLTNDMAAPEQSKPSDPEEDLIDYSDEEDAVVDGPLALTDARQTHDHDDSVSTVDVENNATVNGPGCLGEDTSEDKTGSKYAIDTHENPNDSASMQEQDPNTLQQPSDASAQPDHHSQHDVHDNLDTFDQGNRSLERGTSVSATSPTAIGVDNPSTEQGGQDVENINFHPVNVNFDGKDYWLFQHHDYEGSGDYLLEDESFLKQPLHAVINACREALSALNVIVPNDLELGFRLDSLHHVELYEEHSTCAFFSLNDILRVYLQLYAQDGNSDPEYFCVTLLSRSRVSSLLAELSRAAKEGIGYSGLESIIASGQSLFSSRNAQRSTDHGFGDWEESDVQEAPKTQNSVKNGEQEDYEGEDQESHESEGVHAPYEDEGHDDEGWQGSNNEHEAAPEPEPEPGPEPALELAPEPEPDNTADTPAETATIAVSASGNTVSTTATSRTDEHVEQSIVDAAVSQQTLQDPQDDFVDYSDDEYSEDAPGIQTQASRVSSTSATVQGDDPSQGQDFVENVAQQEQQSEHDEEAMHGGQAGIDADALAEYEDNDYSYEEIDGHAYEEAYEEEYGQEYNEGQESEGYSTYDVAQANVEHANHLGELEQQSAADADDLNITAELNVGESDGVDGTFEEVNDFLEFDDTNLAPHQAVNNDAAEDEIDYSDEEDGVGGQAPVAASAAAGTVVASSTVPRYLSPQGQKRTIDEVGNDVVDATTSTDAKRPRV